MGPLLQGVLGGFDSLAVHQVQWAYGVIAAALVLEISGEIRGGSSPSKPTNYASTGVAVMTLGFDSPTRLQINGSVAQWSEHSPLKRQAEGSSPSRPTIFTLVCKSDKAL